MSDRTSAVLRQLRQTLQQLDGAGTSDGRLLERFIARRDESAFAALVRRHGPMVLGACRRLLGNAHDAEDAFQATFLVLVRRAESVKPRDQVGPWLYGVACRTALKAKSQAARRRSREAEARALRPSRSDEIPISDLRRLLDRALLALPEIYRGPVVLCHLEGRGRREAAALLGVTEGTLSGRLARARALLARRLGGHGAELAGAALTTAVPGSLFTATVRAAADPAFAPVAVARLAEGVTQAMLWKKVQILGAAALVLSVAASGGAVAWVPGGTKASPQFQPAAAPNSPEPPASKPSEAKLPPYVVEAPDVLVIQYDGPADVLRIAPIGTLLVRPDGTVNLGMYGVVSVGGLQLDQVRAAITRQLKRLAPDFDPRDLRVDVAAFNSKFIYVITDIDEAGEQVYRLPVTGAMTILDALGEIKGLKPERLRVWVARPAPRGGKEQILPVDYAAITKRGVTATNYQLLAGDRVFVKTDLPPYSRPDGVILEPPATSVQEQLRGAERFRVREILIVGNERTGSDVIHGELRFQPGDRVTRAQLRAAEARLAKLGLFEVDPMRHVRPTVRLIDAEDGSDSKDVLVRVREKPAAPADEANLMTVNTRSFQIPFRIDRERAAVRRLALFVSDDRGNTYRQVAVAAPDEQHFQFQAPRDGVFWFVVQVQYVNGTREPEKPVCVPPGLKVRVDTRPQEEPAP